MDTYKPKIVTVTYNYLCASPLPVLPCEVTTNLNLVLIILSLFKKFYHIFIMGMF